MGKKEINFLVLVLLFVPLLYSFNQDSNTIYLDETSYEKKEFKPDLKEKYSGKEFTYKEKALEIEKKPDKKVESKFFEDLVVFFAGIFPYLLGLIIVIIILKSFIIPDSSLWKFGKSKNNNSERLIFDDIEDNIESTDLNILLKNAISISDYRLATRYYYLILLKNLSLKNHIEYHKDKTDSEYLFELKNKELKKDFSYLSYIYNYVWYGEFNVNDQKFLLIENKYKSIISKIH